MYIHTNKLHEGMWGKYMVNWQVKKFSSRRTTSQKLNLKK